MTIRRQGLRRLEGDRVVVQTRDGRSIRGILEHAYRAALVVAAVEYLDEASPVDLPGQAVIPLGNVSWIHQLEPGQTVKPRRKAAP